MKLKAKPAFSFGFGTDDMGPILQMQRVLGEENVLNNYFQQSTLEESIMKRQHDMEMASVVALETKAAKKARNGEAAGMKDASTSYTISYFNPELQKTEVLHGSADVRFQDPVTKAIEESVGSQSALSIYGFLASPIMRTQVLPWKLEGILAEREYGTPPPPPAGAAVAPIPVIVRKEQEAREEKRRAELVREALAEFVLRKESVEQALQEELILMDDIVSCLRAGEDIDRMIERLPPLSKARLMLAIRKKLLGRQAIISLLLHDISFLKMLSKKLELFTLEDLLGIYRALRQK